MACWPGPMQKVVNLTSKYSCKHTKLVVAVMCARELRHTTAGTDILVSKPARFGRLTACLEVCKYLYIGFGVCWVQNMAFMC